MRVVVETLLPCSPDLAWGEVVTSRLLVEVAAPLVAIRPADDAELPECWPAGGTVRVRSYLFGALPLGTRAVHFERIDPAAREIQTHESDPLIRRWDHLISIRPAENGRCRYRDQIDIDAGLLTRLVWLFALAFYRHRQRRWRALARRLKAGGTERAI